MNNNSVQQLLMQNLLGSRYQRFNDFTIHIEDTERVAGSGQHDIVSGGTYSDDLDHDYTIKITATNKFQWKKDTGSFSSDVTITGSAQTLSDGVQVTFGHTSGYTVNDEFVIKARLGYKITAESLKNIAINDKGADVTLTVFDAAGSITGQEDVVYKGATANWNNGDLIQRPYILNNYSLYVVIIGSSAPDINIGFN